MKPKTRAVKAWGYVDKRTDEITLWAFRTREMAVHYRGRHWRVIPVEIRECRRGGE